MKNGTWLQRVFAGIDLATRPTTWGAVVPESQSHSMTFIALMLTTFSSVMCAVFWIMLIKALVTERIKTYHSPRNWQSRVTAKSSLQPRAQAVLVSSRILLKDLKPCAASK